MWTGGSPNLTVMFALAVTLAVRGRRRRSSNLRGESSLQKEPDDRHGAKQQQVD
jgi:MYXO-CTERM domain-containing protein